MWLLANSKVVEALNCPNSAIPFCIASICSGIKPTGSRAGWAIIFHNSCKAAYRVLKGETGCSSGF